MKISKKIRIILMIVILIGSIGLIHNFTRVVKNKEEININTLNEIKKLERIDEGELLTPQQFGKFGTYGSSDVEATFYKPVSIYEIKNYLENNYRTMNFNIFDKLPFYVGKTESYLVEVKINNTNETKKQVHFVYLKDKNSLGNYGDEFVVISVYEMDKVRINDYFRLLGKKDKDIFGNKIKVVEKDGLTFINTNITSNEALTYIYYQYDDTEKKLVSNHTVVNRIITHKNGLVYDVGYQLINLTKEKEDKVLDALIDFINKKMK